MKTSALRTWLRQERARDYEAWLNSEKCVACVTPPDTEIRAVSLGQGWFGCANGHRWYRGMDWMYLTGIEATMPYYPTSR